MTNKPTPEQIQRACDLASEAAGMHNAWTPKDYRHHGCLTALADTIAQLDAMQAERDKARADLGEIDRIALHAGWDKACHIAAGKLLAVATIAAPYRVETDPLVEAFRAIHGQDIEEGVEWAVDIARRLRADPRWLEIGRQA